MSPVESPPELDDPPPSLLQPMNRTLKPIRKQARIRNFMVTLRRRIERREMYQWRRDTATKRSPPPSSLSCRAVLGTREAGKPEASGHTRKARSFAEYRSG